MIKIKEGEHINLDEYLSVTGCESSYIQANKSFYILSEEEVNYDRLILNRAINHFGETKQIIKAIEEMAELQKELCKFLNGKNSLLDIRQEIADVEIMIKQMRIIFDEINPISEIRDSKIDGCRKFKLDRLEKLIENSVMTSVK